MRRLAYSDSIHTRMPLTTSTPVGALLFVVLDRTSATPLAEQIYATVRSAVEGRRLLPGTPLPSSRALAEDLGVARSTVTLAFEHLRKEGYIEGSAGRANRIAARTPQPPRAPEPRRSAALALPPVAARSRNLPGWQPEILDLLGKRPRPFRPAIPAVDLFPVDVWHRLLSRAWRRTPPQSLTYGDLTGYPPLRRAIAEHLRSARGLACTEDQVIIFNGSQQAMDVCARMLLDPGDHAWVEDPGYLGGRLAIAANGGVPVPVPVDAEGIDVAAGIGLAPDARLACVTPARQFPLGHAMSTSRRVALLDWARQARAWIFEDDYDGDIRYASAPLQPLQAMDATGCVLLAGSFSKILLPALRLGYLVVPDGLVDTVRRLRMSSDMGNAVFPQTVLAEFITEGHFARHIRRIRAVYEERYELLLASIRERLSGRLSVTPAGAGLSMPVFLDHGISEDDVLRLAPAHDLDLKPLSFATTNHPQPPGLLLGFGGLDTAEIREGINRLERLFDALDRED
jgi:GntR family transcriptional regulator/MocR family aminotransferase